MSRPAFRHARPDSLVRPASSARLRTGALVAAGAALATGSAGFVLGAFSDTAGASAADLVVTNLTDTSGLGSLRHAIEYSNANGGGAVTVQAGVTGTIHLIADLPYISQPISITGPGSSSLAVDGGDTFKMFDTGTASLTISGLSLTNAGGGRATIRSGRFSYVPPVYINVHAPVALTDVVISGNDGGAGIQSNNIPIGNYVASSLTNCVITGNAGAGVATTEVNWTITGSTISYNGQGGLNDAYGRTVSISHSTFDHNGGRGIDLFETHSVQIDHVESSNNTSNFGAGLRMRRPGSGATVTDSSFHDNSATYVGGAGVWLYGGSVDFTRVTITNNTSNVGGGMVVNSFSTVHLTDSTISGNSASGHGGGLSVLNASLFLTNTSMTGNSAYAGGAISASSSIVNVLYSDLSTNTATHGGALAAENQAQLSFAHSLSAGNHALTGGALWMSASTATIDNSTITGNDAVDHSVARATATSSMTINESTITANTDSNPTPTSAIDLQGSTATVTSSILWGNTRSSTNEIGGTPTSAPSVTRSIIDFHGTIVDGGGNLAGDPLLAPLANNGGATRTMALTYGSPALDAGSSSSTSSFDQRGTGYSRQIGARLDIGAYEAQTPPAPPTTTTTTTSTTTTSTTSTTSTTTPSDTGTTVPGGDGALPTTGTSSDSASLAGSLLLLGGGLLAGLAGRRRRVG